MIGPIWSGLASLIVRTPGETFMIGAPRPLSRDFLRCLACVVGLALIVAWASLQLRIHTRGDVVHNLTAILYGQPLLYGDGIDPTLPFYNRILFPGLHAALAHLLPVLSGGQWYIVLRIASFEAAFAIFALVCYRSLKVPFQDFARAAALLAVATIATFGFGWEDPSDAIDMATLSLGVLCALEKRFVLCLALGVFFASNRESAAYVGIVWYFLSPQPPGRGPWRVAVEGFVICAASYATTLGLRFAISETGRSNWIGLSHNLDALIQEIREFTPINTLPILLALVVTLSANLTLRNRLARRFVLLAAVFVIPGLLFGHLRELRVFLPCLVMLCFAVAAGKPGQSSSPSSPIRHT